MANKTGIITFHRAYNYGALLQAYALQNKVSGITGNAEIIDFVNYVDVKKKESFKRKLILLAREILYLDRTLGYSKRKKKMDNFINTKMKLSKPYNVSTIKETNAIYDSFIVGSDQVWNMSFENSDIYLLKFVNDTNKKISYAASFGYSRIPDQYLDLSISGIKRFDNIAVRETSGIDIVKEQIKRDDVVLTIDPTFLLTKKEWKDKLISNTPIQKGKYLLVYLVTTQTNLLEYAKKYAAKHDLKLCIIYNGTESKVKGAINLYNLGVEEFLNYFYNATTIMTTSFHGLAFSLNFNKNVYYELNSNKKTNSNDRLITLAASLGLVDREITSTELKEEKEIDWQLVNSNMERIRNDGINYLKNALKK